MTDGGTSSVTNVVVNPLRPWPVTSWIVLLSSLTVLVIRLPWGRLGSEKAIVLASITVKPVAVRPSMMKSLAEIDGR